MKYTIDYVNIVSVLLLKAIILDTDKLMFHLGPKSPVLTDQAFPVYGALEA